VELLTALLLAGNAWLMSRLIESESPVASFLSFLLLFYGQLIGLLLFLGWCGAVNLFSLTLLAGLLFLFLLVNQPQLKRQPCVACFSLHLPTPIILCLSLTVATYLVVVCSQAIYHGLTTDALLYHLPFAARWYQTGKILPVPLVFSDVAMSYYPINGNVVFLAHFLFLKSDFLLRFSQLPFALIAGLAFFLLLQQVGISPGKSFAGACLLLLFRPILRQSIIAFVDLMVVAFFLSAVYYFSQPGRKNFLLGSLATGLLVGTKTTGCLLLLPLALLLSVRFPRRNGSPGLPAILTGFFIFFYFGGYSYLNNFLLTGNPFYPARISCGAFHWPGFYLFPAVSLSEKGRILWNTFRRPFSSVDASRTCTLVLGLLWLATVLRSLKKPRLLLHLLTPAVVVLAYLIFIPVNYFQLRHLLCIYPFLLSGTIILIGSPSRPDPFFSEATKSALLVGLTVYFFLDTLAGYTLLLKPVGFTAAGFFILFYGLNKIRQRWLSLTIWLSLTAFFLGIVPVIYSPAAAAQYQNNRYRILRRAYRDQADLWEIADLLGGSRKKVVAYVGEFLTYPFCGRLLQNYVYHQPVNSAEEKLIHSYHPRPIPFPAEPDTLSAPYRTNPDYHLWLAGLRKHGTEFVVVRKRPGRKAIEEYWMEQDDRFRLLFTSEAGSIYQVNLRKPLRTRPDQDLTGLAKLPQFRQR